MDSVDKDEKRHYLGINFTGFDISITSINRFIFREIANSNQIIFSNERFILEKGIKGTSQWIRIRLLAE